MWRDANAIDRKKRLFFSSFFVVEKSRPRMRKVEIKNTETGHNDICIPEGECKDDDGDAEKQQCRKNEKKKNVMTNAHTPSERNRPDLEKTESNLGAKTHSTPLSCTPSRLDMPLPVIFHSLPLISYSGLPSPLCSELGEDRNVGREIAAHRRRAAHRRLLAEGLDAFDQ